MSLIPKEGRENAYFGLNGKKAKTSRLPHPKCLDSTPRILHPFLHAFCCHLSLPNKRVEYLITNQTALTLGSSENEWRHDSPDSRRNLHPL